MLHKNEIKMKSILEYNQFLDPKIIWIVGFPTGESYEVTEKELDTLLDMGIVTYDIDLGLYRFDIDKKMFVFDSINIDFFQWVLGKYQVSLDEIEHLNCSRRGFPNFRGVEKIINLKTFYCDGNNLINLNINNLTKLKFLDCRHNRLKELDISNLINLEELYCGYNQIEDLDNLENLNLLTTLHCNNNQLTNLLVIEKLKNIKYINCSNNKFSNTYKNYLKSYCARNSILLILD